MVKNSSCTNFLPQFLKMYPLTPRPPIGQDVKIIYTVWGGGQKKDTNKLGLSLANLSQDY